MEEDGAEGRGTSEVVERQGEGERHEGEVRGGPR